MRRNWLIAGLSLLTLSFCLFYSCQSPKPLQGEAGMKQYLFVQTDSLLAQLDSLAVQVKHQQPLPGLFNSFAQSRRLYKKTESIVEYYFQGLTKRINGPALPDVKTEDGQVWPPHGFQVIEQMLYDGYTDSLSADLQNEIRLLQTDLRFVKSNMAYNTISPAHLYELVQHQLIRVATMGITGADAPLSKHSIQEAAWSLEGLQELLQAYGLPVQQTFTSAIAQLQSNNNFDSFDRLLFLQTYLMPLSETLSQSLQYAPGADSLMVKPFRGTLADLLRGKGFNADYYTGYAAAVSNPEKLALGKALFYDPQLSRSGSISCASCHQPELYFTDGKAKAGDFVHGGSLPRNTPTLYYAAMQSRQFYDMRSVTLEDQADEVMKNHREFDLSSDAIAEKLLASPTYTALFAKAFAPTTQLGGFEVRNALGTYVRSLAPFSSPFDAYMNGHQQALTEEAVQGFNLFAGKAKCATCHFMPLFNGNIPPWFTKSESEIIGVPLRPVWQQAVIDSDSGRYAINRLDALQFAFKTPTVRNADKTAPYMHNGVYQNLNDVVEFYHKGGGAGIGITLPSQTLPFDSLVLSAQEKKAIVVFMQSLTDAPYKND